MRGIYEEGINTSELQTMVGADWFRTYMFYFSKLPESNSYTEIYVTGPKLLPDVATKWDCNMKFICLRLMQINMGDFHEHELHIEQKKIEGKLLVCTSLCGPFVTHDYYLILCCVSFCLSFMFPCNYFKRQNLNLAEESLNHFVYTKKQRSLAVWNLLSFDSCSWALWIFLFIFFWGGGGIITE